MGSPGPEDLYDHARELLDAADYALAASVAGRIERMYVSPTAPVADCEQLTVHTFGPVEADTVPLSPPLAPSRRIPVQGAVHLVAFAVTALRYVPAVTDTDVVPHASDLEECAKSLMSDCWALWNGIRNAISKGALFDDHTFVYLDPTMSEVAMGGIGGWQLNVRINLDGYDVAV